MRKIQEKIKKFIATNNLKHKPEMHMLDLVSEVGEISKELLKMTDYGNRSIKFNEEISLELGDALFSLIALANSLNVDLETALDMVLKKYEKRLAKGSASSEND
ncbi:nucleotide pyrophosphohydrolase [Candidatus Pacearchaeota archaeon]|nr:nucleotide pyrophosphohydrolase [Candidatus Pacearchaeota archaeon]